VNDPGRREMEDLLRHALNDAAARIHPAGDGLERVRERAARRRRRLLWARPSLTVATATVLVALAATLPLYLRSTGADGDRAALGSASGRTHPTTSRPTSPPSASVSSAPVGSTTPDATVQGSPLATRTAPDSLPDMTTVWPYGSRHEGSRRADQDVADSVHPVLRDPRMTAVKFIQSFVGTTDPLMADEDAPLAAGIGVTVFRKSADGDREPVSLVYLVRVRKGDDAPYVVVDASTPPQAGDPDSMSIQPGPLKGVAPLNVTGTVNPAPPDPQIASVHVELREPGQDQTLASQSPALTADPNQTPQQSWIATLTPIRPLSTPTGTVAAWTVDAQNHLLSFVAVPTSTG